MYGDRDLLYAEAGFTWPQAPGADGGLVDLRTLFGEPGTRFVAAVRQPERGIGFVAAVNPAEHVALIYVFAARDFPWLTLGRRIAVDRSIRGTATCRREGSSLALRRCRLEGERSMRLALSWGMRRHAALRRMSGYGRRRQWQPCDWPIRRERSRTSRWKAIFFEW